MRLVIVPRWGGNADSDFYPWLREQVGDTFDSVSTAELGPTADVPQIAACVANLQAQLGPDPGDVVVLGHSVGCQTVMRTLEDMEGRVAGTLLVAGWFTVDDPWDTIRPWIEQPIDDERVRTSTGPLRVLVSTNDRFTADYQATRSAFESRLGARVRVVDQRDHFNDTPQPEVLEELKALVQG